MLYMGRCGDAQLGSDKVRMRVVDAAHVQKIKLGVEVIRFKAIQQHHKCTIIVAFTKLANMLSFVPFILIR
jgi:hypothetical protein